MINGQLTKQRALMVACELAQKFGFISRAVIWNHLAHDGIASKYKYWRFIKNALEFTPYKAGITFSHHLVLSLEYRKYLGEGTAVSNRASIYFAHDEYLMGLILYLKAAGVVADYWTEQELKMDRLLAIQTLGGDPDAKMPDLIFDLSTDNGLIRVAIEIERTRKSQKRYRLVHWGYSRLKRIDLLIFGVVDAKTESAIYQEFDRAVAGSQKRSIGYFSLGDFAKSGLGCELRIRGKTPKFDEFLKRVCGNKWVSSEAGRIKIEEKVNNQLSTETPFVEISK